MDNWLDLKLRDLGYTKYGVVSGQPYWTDGRTEVVDDRGFAGVFRVRPMGGGRDLFTANSPAKIVDLIRQAREMFS